MKRFLWVKIVGILLFVYAIGGFIALPYAIKEVVPQKVKEATNGGIFRVESASFNPFNFHLSLDKFSFKTPQDRDFIAIEHLSLNLNPLEYLWKQGWVIEELQLIGPKIVVAKDSKGVMNFEWLTQEESNTTEESDEPLALLIRSFTLKEGSVGYLDLSEGKNYRQEIEDIGFYVENIDLRDMSTSRGVSRLYATINDGGYLDVRGKMDSLKPFSIHGSVAFSSGGLYTPWRYFADKLPIEVADGVLDTSFDYALNGDDLNATKLSKLNAKVNRLRIIPKGEKKTLLALDGFSIKDATVWPMKKRLDTTALLLNGLDVSASRNPDGRIDWENYLDEINRAFPEDENETSEPWSFRLNNVSFQKIGVTWNDYAPDVPYSLRLNDLEVSTKMLESDETTPLMAHLSTGAIAMTKIGDGNAIATVGSVTIEGINVHRAVKKATVSAIVVNNPSIAFKRLKTGDIDLLKSYLYRSKESSETSSVPWKYALDRVALEEGSIRFVDELPSKKVAIDLDSIRLSISDFTSNPHDPNHLSLFTHINRKGSLRLDASLVREQLSSQGKVEIRGVDAALFDPYIEPSTYASLKRGIVTLLGEYRYAEEKIDLRGKLALNDWVVNDARDQSVLIGWESIGVTPFGYRYPENQLKINHLNIHGLYTNLLFDANKTFNFSTLSKAGNEANGSVEKTNNPFGVDIVKLVISNGSANFSDLSLPLIFKTYVHDLNGEVLGISTTKNITTLVTLAGGVDEYGMAKIGGKLNTTSPSDFTDITVKFENLDLKHYTPYSLEFLGYKIEGGKLYLNLGYVINKGSLNGQNKILIKQVQLGEEKAGGAPWPLGFVVALLEDSEGVIDIDLPIEGDINNPDFKYGKVVWQVIGNLFTKAITSPFRLLGSMMGLESEDDSLSTVVFDPGEAIVLPPEREKLDKLSAILIKRTKLTLGVHGGFESVEDERALRTQKLVASITGDKTKVMSVKGLSVESLEATAKKMVDASELKELKRSMQEAYPSEGEFAQHYSAALIQKLISHHTVASLELETLAAKRSAAIVEYLHKTPALSSRVHALGNEKVNLDKNKQVAVRLELAIP